MNKLVTVATFAFFVLGSSLASAQTGGPMMMGKDTSKTGATPPNAGASAPITVDPKAKKPALLPGADTSKAGASPPNAGASAPIAAAPAAKGKK